MNSKLDDTLFRHTGLKSLNRSFSHGIEYLYSILLEFIKQFRT